ncbi:hypothetical protein L3V82_02900 [Thiotrichales bacterium 19S3-7]|nr:hypothetical protein [Thiotrichales bacterium 19S3-7]MCF6801117.1 hypothetical protein [Thiotrichales bacterium 19S3-11]
MVNIEIKNCNNIDSATIKLCENKLNIKFAPNGTGKSTIAKAIIYELLEDYNIDRLLPFKLQESNPNVIKPEIIGLDNIQSVMCFDEEYVNQYTFKEDELVNNSFEIFIKTKDYKENEAQIIELVSDIKQLFKNNKNLESLITNFEKLAGAFKTTQSGLSKASSIVKALGNGNLLQHIPIGLEDYRTFINSPYTVEWIAWQTTGYEYIEQSDICPFCTSNVQGNKQKIKKVGEKYDKNTINHLKNFIDTIDMLSGYFSDEAKSKIEEIKNLNNNLEAIHESFIISLKSQIDDFLEKLKGLRNLSMFTFETDNEIASELESYKITFTFYPDINSQKMQEEIKPINSSINTKMKQVGELQKVINQQKIEINRVVEKHQTEINNFLINAGYNYNVKIEGEGEQAQLKLYHLHYNQPINGGHQHLSFGEKNAFALVLFMYECLSKNPDLIILDDPISSFDKNKKYAILDMLFKNDNDNSCLKNKTTLMLTHDMEPIIDTIKVLPSLKAKVAFLNLSNGIINEVTVKSDDIVTFSKICNNVLQSENIDEIIKLIHLRREYEVTDNKQSNAYEVISNALKGRAEALDYRKSKDKNNNYPKMEATDFNSGCNDINKKLSRTFSYTDIVKKVSDIEKLKSLYNQSNNRYNKLQIFRLINQDNASNSIVNNFITKTYHIENEFICQLDPSKFDLIPEYIIKECDKILNK